MAAPKSKFTIGKTIVTSEYTSRLELRGDDIKRFFRNPARYLQSCLRKKGLKWREVRVERLDRDTVKRAMASSGGTVIIKVQWVHIDFDFIHHPPQTCQWVAQITIIVISNAL